MDTIEALYLNVAAIDILQCWTRPLCPRRFAGLLSCWHGTQSVPAAASARGASGAAPAPVPHSHLLGVALPVSGQCVIFDARLRHKASCAVGRPVNGNRLKSFGTHPADATTIITGSTRTPPPQEIIPTNQSVSAQGKKNTGSLLSWRIKGGTPSEPSARALTLHNPHSLTICAMQMLYCTCFTIRAP